MSIYKYVHMFCYYYLYIILLKYKEKQIDFINEVVYF